jgi:hypothetical protein
VDTTNNKYQSEYQEHGLSQDTFQLRSFIVGKCTFDIYGTRLASVEMLYAVPNRKANAIGSNTDYTAARVLLFNVNGGRVHSPEHMMSIVMNFLIGGIHPKIHVLGNELTARIVENDYWVLGDAALSTWSLHNALLNGHTTVLKGADGSWLSEVLWYRVGMDKSCLERECFNMVCPLDFSIPVDVGIPPLFYFMHMCLAPACRFCSCNFIQRSLVFAAARSLIPTPV